MRQEMHRNCTDATVSSVRAGITVRYETAGQGLFRLNPAQGGCGPDCLRNRCPGTFIQEMADRVCRDIRVDRHRPGAGVSADRAGTNHDDARMPM